MPVSEVAGESVTRTVLPQWSPTPSRLTALRMVCCLMTAPSNQQLKCHSTAERQIWEFISAHLRASITSLGACRADDTPLSRRRLTFETLHVDDDPDLMTTVARLDRDTVQRRALHDGAEPVSAGVERFAVQTTMDDGVRARLDVDATHNECLDLVHVQAFVDPRHEQAFGTVALSANLSALEGRDAHR